MTRRASRPSVGSNGQLPDNVTVRSASQPATSDFPGTSATGQLFALCPVVSTGHVSDKGPISTDERSLSPSLSVPSATGQIVRLSTGHERCRTGRTRPPSLEGGCPESGCPGLSPALHLAETGKPVRGGSRVGGRGVLLRSLRGLVRRVERFGIHRARSVDDRAWAARLADHLDAAMVEALAAPGAVASLTVAEHRAAVSRKVSSQPTEQRQ
jgi:hypothetical protein